MSLPFAITFKKIPFLRLLTALISGILAEWYFQFSFLILLIIFCGCIFFLSLFYFIPPAKKFHFRWLQGAFILLIIAATGAIIIYQKDIRHQTNYFNSYKNSSAIKVVLQEPLVNKPKSYKALASVETLETNGLWKNVQGKMILYFKKDSIAPALNYGSQIVFTKKLQSIGNEGNPGEFDYKTYCLQRGIEQQIFLNKSEYIILPEKKTHWLPAFLFSARRSVIQTIQKNIPGEKNQGVAEALLIGYRDDLDKNLIQAYSNAGVVHIIVISGLHVGLIYGLMLGIFSFFKKINFTRWLKPVIILLALWIFCLLTGAAAPVLRSTTMFSFILVGDILQRKKNIYNTLAASAFCLLIYNPFFLWDTGFLISYAAVTGIAAFMRPLYHSLYFKNKLLDKIWALMSLSISAQLLTFPVILYTFHQFANLFLFTNLIIVPLAALILYSGILLLCIAPITGFAKYVGLIIGVLIALMNGFIENSNRLPFAVSHNIEINFLQIFLLYGCIIADCIWLIKKLSKAFIVSLVFFAAFIIVQSIDLIKTNIQQKIIVYNIPNHSAIDIIDGKQFEFTGDKNLSTDSSIRDYYFKPSHVLYRLQSASGNSFAHFQNNLISFSNKNILILNNALPVNIPENKIFVDIIIISKNPQINIHRLSGIFNCKEIVFDSSNPLWKIQRWKKDCDSLHLHFHSVPEEGAFIMDL